MEQRFRAVPGPDRFTIADSLYPRRIFADYDQEVAARVAGRLNRQPATAGAFELDRRNVEERIRSLELRHAGMVSANAILSDASAECGEKVARLMALGFSAEVATPWAEEGREYYPGWEIEDVAREVGRLREKLRTGELSSPKTGG
jgi:hypothetical protein